MHPLEPVVAYGGALVALTLGLYLLARGRGRLIAVVAGAATLSFACYLLGLGVGGLAPEYGTWLAWVRWTWPAAAFAPPLWHLVTLALLAEDGPPRAATWARWAFRPVAVLWLLVAAGLAVASGATGLVFRWSAAPAAAAVWRAPPGPLFPAYQLWLLVLLVWAGANQLVLWRASPPGTPLRARFGWLLVSAVLFMLGGAYLGLPAVQVADSGLPGEALLIAGMAIMGWNVLRYGALVAGEVAGAEFGAFALHCAAVAGVYGALLWTLGPPEFWWRERALPLLLLIVATHALAGVRRRGLARLLARRARADARGELAALGEETARMADPLSALAEARARVDALVRAEPTTPSLPPAEFRVMVENALRHLNDLPALSEHPLAPLAGAQPEATPLERAARLRERLRDAIDRLKPAGQPPAPGAPAGPGGFLHFLVLHEAYVEGRLNKQIMQRHRLSEGTFHRARRRAIDAVAADLHQRLVTPG